MSVLECQNFFIVYVKLAKRTTTANMPVRPECPRGVGIQKGPYKCLNCTKGR